MKNHSQKCNAKENSASGDKRPGQLEDDNVPIAYSPIITTVLHFVKKVKGSPNSEDQLTRIQESIGGGKSVKLIRENTTRWNSVLDFIERFNSLRNFVTVLEPDFASFDWETLGKIIKAITPLME